MYSWCPSCNTKKIHIELDIFSLLGGILEALHLTINGIRDNLRLDLVFQADKNNKKCVDDSRHIPHVEDLGMIRILVTSKRILSFLVLHLVPTLCYNDGIKPHNNHYIEII